MNAQPTESRVSSFIPPLWILSLLGVFGVIWLLVALKELIVLLVVGYCLAYAIEPLVSALERRKVRRPIGVAVLFAIAIFFLTSIILTVVPALVTEYARLVDNLPDYYQTARVQLTSNLRAMSQHLPQPLRSRVTSISIADLVPALDASMVKNAAAAIFGFVLRGYSVTLTIINLTLLPFIVFYLSVEFSSWHQRAVLLFPPKLQKTVVEVAREIDSYTSAFVRGQFLVCTILFSMYAVGLGILGIQLWFLLALISGFGNMIPFLGFLIGIVLSSIMALVTYGDMEHLTVVWALYALVQLLEGNFITPKILGDRVGLGQLTIILALFAGGSLFGLLGLFLAVPFAAGLRVVLDRGHSWLYADGTTEPLTSDDVLEEVLNSSPNTLQSDQQV